MRWTEATPSLRISFTRRAERIAFWIVTAVMTCGLVWVGAWSRGAQGSWAWGLAAGVGIVLPGILYRPWFDDGVRLWNRAASTAARILESYILSAYYYIVIGCVGAAGSSLDPLLEYPAASTWAKREADIQTQRHVSAACDDAPLRPGMAWHDGLRAYARCPGNGWAVCLLPLVWLLIVLRPDQQENALPTSTYTLS